jgi:hypothetical protein
MLSERIFADAVHYLDAADDDPRIPAGEVNCFDEAHTWANVDHRCGDGRAIELIKAEVCVLSLLHSDENPQRQLAWSVKTVSSTVVHDTMPATDSARRERFPA